LKAAELTEPSGLFWGDEMRVGLIGQVRRVWAPRGVKIRQPVEMEYEWEYLNLAINGLEGTLLWEWTPDMKANSIAGVVERLKEDGAQAIVWDRAPGHRGQQVKDVGVALIEQPPYSPELNPAERMFEELRRAVEGKVYGDIEKKKEAVEQELQRFAAGPKRVKSLAGWSWIQESVRSLSTEKMALH
jgi:transposase